MKPYGDNIYTNIRVLNVLESDTEFEYLAFISIDSLLVYKKYYL